MTTELLPDLTDVRKAAIVLMSLDKATAAEITSQLPAELAQRVMLEIAALEDVPQTDRHAALGEFCESAASGQTAMHSHLSLLSDSVEQDPEQIAVAADLDRSTGDRYAASAIVIGPFEFLCRYPDHHIVDLLIDEHPQTIAAVLVHLGSSYATRIVDRLPVSLRSHVQERMTVTTAIDTAVASVVAEVLEQRLRAAAEIKEESQEFSAATAVRRETHQCIPQPDEHLAESHVPNPSLGFEALKLFDNASVTALLMEISSWQWAVALRGAPTEATHLILRHMSEPAAARLRQELDYLGPVRLSDVESMQIQIMRCVERLIEAGVMRNPRATSVAGGPGAML